VQEELDELEDRSRDSSTVKNRNKKERRKMYEAPKTCETHQAFQHTQNGGPQRRSERERTERIGRHKVKCPNLIFKKLKP
jgi:hypothetical protein